MADDYSMVQECTDGYEVRDLPNGSAEIFLRIPARFRDLWIYRLSALRTTEAEITEFEPHDL